MTTGTSILPELRITVANFRPGSTDAGSTGRWDQMMRWDKAVSALRAWQPHLVLCQEISAAAPGGLRASLWTTANALGMFPLLGPPAPALGTGTYPAILIAASAGLVIIDAGPAFYSTSAGPQPAWCDALVQVPGWAHPLRAYSVGLPELSSTEQRSQADHLASRISSLGELAVAGGNWNSYSRADTITAAALEVAPRTCAQPGCGTPRRTGPSARTTTCTMCWPRSAWKTSPPSWRPGSATRIPTRCPGQAATAGWIAST